MRFYHFSLFIQLLRGTNQIVNMHSGMLAKFCVLILLPCVQCENAALNEDCDGVEWLSCRSRLINEVFGYPHLPARSSPDYIIEEPNYSMRGFPGPGEKFVLHL